MQLHLFIYLFVLIIFCIFFVYSFFFLFIHLIVYLFFFNLFIFYSFLYFLKICLCIYSWHYLLIIYHINNTQGSAVKLTISFTSSTELSCDNITTSSEMIININQEKFKSVRLYACVRRHLFYLKVDGCEINTEVFSSFQPCSNSG